MSACYHVCPTNVTFQFDTTFMYLISLLMFMKLYQVRHADVSPDAVVVFLGLGVALILEIISIYHTGPAFWVLFSICYIMGIIVVTIHSYNMGQYSYTLKNLINISKIFIEEVTEVANDKKKIYKKRKLLLLLINCVVNIALCFYFAGTGTGAVAASNHLLVIFILNLASYYFYYCIMKILSGEHLHIGPIIYLVCCMITLLPAMYFFTQKEKKTTASPSISRTLNKDCLLLDFFDGHDIWHFLGGAGVFFAFMFVLTIDDDVRFKRRDKIGIF